MFSAKQVNTDNSTVIARECTINGTVIAEGLLRVDGKVTGELNVDGDLIIGPQAIIEAAITAKKVIIAGQVMGNVTAQAGLELESTATLKGDISTRSLKIATGAIFTGTSSFLTDDKLTEITAAK